MYQESYFQRQQNASNNQAILVSDNEENKVLAKARRTISKLAILRRKYLSLVKELAPQANKRVVQCAALLIDYVRHWQEWKLQNHRTPWVYQPLKFIHQDLMEMFSKHVIRAAIALLEELSLLQKRHNPGNYQDKTYQYNLLFDRIQNLIERLGITEEGTVETPVQSPFVNSKVSEFNPEHREFQAEVSEFNAEKYQQLPYKDSSLPVLASLSEESENKFQESKKEEENPQEAVCDSLSNELDCQKNLLSADLDKIKVDGLQGNKASNEGRCSAARDVNQNKTPRKVERIKSDYYLNGFKSQDERDGFYQALLELGKQKSEVRSPAGWANNIIKDINAGGLCEYLNEYRRSEPLGMCEKQEWEFAPGQVYPRFLSFLRGKLKTNQMSEEQAIKAAHTALKDTSQAKEHWESFKRTVVNFAEQWERDKAMGITSAYMPPELLPQAEVAIQEAAQAMQTLQTSCVQEKAFAPTIESDALAPTSEPEAEDDAEVNTESEVPLPETVAQWHKQWNSKAAIVLRPLIIKWVEATNGAVIITDDGPVLKSELVTAAPSPTIEEAEEAEAPVVIGDWQIAEPVTVHRVDPKIKSLMKWNGLQGTVQAINEVSCQCLVAFVIEGVEERQYIPFRYLMKG